VKRLVAIFFFGMCRLSVLCADYCLELNASYDSFRGLPDGSWNGNYGAIIAANSAISLTDCIDLQLGGSYGLYNWDGRNNLVFADPKALQRVGFFTVGVSSSYDQWNGGITYDRMFSSHFGIYDLSPSIDQVRFQLGYQCCFDELGFWATSPISTAHELALGIPTDFRAVQQFNFYWQHQYANCANTMVWLGIPYGDSLRYSGNTRAGNLILGFSFRVPLVESLFVDGNGSYMSARKASGSVQSRNYACNMCIGLTYCYNDAVEYYKSPFMSLANHSNFFVDTNLNQ
jgi:hypothetical protein